MDDFEKDLIFQAKRVAYGSFIIGSLIFFLFLFFSIEVLAYIGILFLFLAIIANAITLFQFLYLLFLNKSINVEIRNGMLLLLINIPIALLYLKIGANLFRSRFGI